MVSSSRPGRGSRLAVVVVLFLALLVGTGACAGGAGPPDPDLTVSLGYGTFRGAYSEKYNISYWGRIPFAAPPVGENRFRAPQPPVPLPGGTVYDSNTTFDSCPQREVRLSGCRPSNTLLALSPSLS